MISPKDSHWWELAVALIDKVANLFNDFTPNTIPFTCYLPAIDTQYEVDVVPGQNTIATNPRVPGHADDDPSGLASSLNFYVYAGSNSINYSDHFLS